jgi:demethylmenaquinone methyltransferase/2-methoxy-6-polyprenyl-1,4-benzoquinol methylase
MPSITVATRIASTPGAPRGTVGGMCGDDVESLLAEQVAYYRARAAEYDATTPVATDTGSLRGLEWALEAFGPRGRVLELACGTGQWTARLARHASELTALDSAPEMLALADARVGEAEVRFVLADIFSWRPPQRYDVVFFAAWLSHVPPERFDRFWALIDDCLVPDGRVFIVDELPAVAAHEEVVAESAVPTVSRTLRGGQRYRTVKVFFEPESLRERLAAIGWSVDVHPVGWRFFSASGQRSYRL